MADKTLQLVKRTEYENRGYAPVYIDTSEIIFDAEKQKTVMKLTLFNNSAKTVKSAYFNAGCFDENLNLCVQLRNIPYVNVDVKPHSEFGKSQAVEVPIITKSVFVEVSKVLFSDSTVWVNKKQELSEDLVSDEAMGEEWQRLRNTKAIMDANSKKVKKKFTPTRKKVMIWLAVVLSAGILAAGIYSSANYLSDRKEAYKNGMNLYINQDFENAVPVLERAIDDYIYFGKEKNELNYSAAISNMKIKDYKAALKYFDKCRDYKNTTINIREITGMYNRLIAGGINHSAAVQKDGTVIAVGDNSLGQCETNGWTDVVGIAAGDNHTVGMKSDGTLYAAGSNDYGQSEVSAWSDIVQVAAGLGHTVALKANGRVIARGSNQYGQCDVQEWKDIVQITASGNHTVGLKLDGTVISIGWNNYGQCDVSEFNNIVSIATGEKNTVGVKSDGTLIAVGDNSYGQCKVSDVKNAVSASVGKEYIVYIDSNAKTKSKGRNDVNQASVSLWNNVMAVSCGNAHTIGISESGGIYTVGDSSDGQLGLDTYKNIGAENIKIVE